MRLALIFTLIFPFCFLSSCSSDKGISPQPPPQATGTSDGGGGIVPKSTIEQVRTAVLESQKVITRSELYPFLNYQNEFDFDYQTTITLLKILDPRRDYVAEMKEYHEQAEAQKMDDLHTIRWREHDQKLFEISYRTVDYPFEISNSEFVDNVNFYLNSDSSCPAPDKDDADASVDVYSLDATICFSSFNLRRFPPDVLEAQVAGLWIHELAHMSGHPEEVAKKVQAMMVRSYDFLKSEAKAPFAKLMQENFDQLELNRAEINKSFLGLETYLRRNQENRVFEYRTKINQLAIATKELSNQIHKQLTQGESLRICPQGRVEIERAEALANLVQLSASLEQLAKTVMEFDFNFEATKAEMAKFKKLPPSDSFCLR